MWCCCCYVVSVNLKAGIDEWSARLSLSLRVCISIAKLVGRDRINESLRHMKRRDADISHCIRSCQVRTRKFRGRVLALATFHSCCNSPFTFVRRYRCWTTFLQISRRLFSQVNCLTWNLHISQSVQFYAIVQFWYFTRVLIYVFDMITLMLTYDSNIF